MTNKEKDLLLKDLYGRLPYGVVVYVEHDWFEDEVPPYDCELNVESHTILNNFSQNPLSCDLTIKPYLRPMSSLTDEEKDELYTFIHWAAAFDEAGNIIIEDYVCGINLDTINKYIEWLNKKGFDYRGLIPMGLALEASERMYN